MWTRFWDMHSGGKTKVFVDGIGKEMIFIQASKEEAKIIFYNHFSRNPNNITCTCCGSDYSIDEGKLLSQLTGYHRNCAYEYRDAKGRVIDKKEAWIPGKGMKKDYTSKYVERHDPARTWAVYQTLSEYLSRPDILVVRIKDIKPEERTGELPETGWIWMG